MRIRQGVGFVAILLITVAAAKAAAPATPSYVAVERAMSRIETDWETIPPDRNPHAESWRTLFGLIRQDLQTYSKSEKARRPARGEMRRLYDISESLSTTGWPAAAEVREELRRVAPSSNGPGLGRVSRLEAANRGDSEQRDQWNTYIKDKLRPAVSAVESAASVNDRVQAVDRLHGVIDKGRDQIQGSPFAQTASLMVALDDLYDTPNLELILDGSAVSTAICPRASSSLGPSFFGASGRT